MRVFFDTEFIDNGQTILPISIGMVREDGEQYYAEFSETDLDLACSWVKQHVISKLQRGSLMKTKAEIAHEVREFCGERPEFWTYFGAYDWVVLCQLYGRMIDVPEGWPMFPLDIMNLIKILGVQKPFLANSREHDALFDALWTRDLFLKIVENIGVT